jgi:hypothetical protein
MPGSVLAVLLQLGLVAVAACVVCLAARRLWLSRSANARLYRLAAAFAAAGALGSAQTGAAGAQVDAGGMVLAAASLPFWLLVRWLTAQGPRPGAAGEGPVFVSVRGVRAPGGLRAGPSRLTSGA